MFTNTNPGRRRTLTSKLNRFSLIAALTLTAAAFSAARADPMPGSKEACESAEPMTTGRLRRVGRSTHTKVWGIAALTGTSAQGGRKISRTQTRKEQDDVLETDALARRRIRAVRRRTRRPGYKFHPRVDGVRRTRDRFFGSFQL